MRPVFVLSPPRARTCWLTVYLNGLGIAAIHEGWKYFPTSTALLAAMQGMGKGVVVNVDSSNALHLSEIEQAFPDARFVNIYREWGTCEQSLSDALGVTLPDAAMIGQRIEWEQRQKMDTAFEIDFDEWRPDVSMRLVEWLDPTVRIDPIWHYFCAGLDIQLFSSRLNEEMQSLLERSIVTTGG